MRLLPLYGLTALFATRCLRFLRIACLTSCFLSTYVLAQADMAAPTPWNNSPSNSSDIDTVSTTNGSLQLHVPIWSIKQRGSLKFNLMLRYNSPGFYYTKDCQNAYNTCDEAWNFDGDGVFITSSIDVRVSAIAATYQNFSRPIFPADGSLGYYWQVTTPASGVHKLADAGGGSFRAIDGSGWMYNEAASTLFSEDGTRYAYSSMPKDAFGTPETGLLQFVEDTNGNRITLNYTSTTTSTGTGTNFTGWTDTLGRVIPVPPLGSMYHDPLPLRISPQRSSQYGSCPGDNNPIIWMPPGETIPFLFCYTTVHLQSYLFSGQGSPDVPVSSNPRVGNKFEAYADLTLISSIVRPDQKAWTFQYTPSLGYDGVHNYGELTQVSLPTGGAFGYTWNESYVSDCFDSYKGRQTRSMVVTRTVDANDSLGPRLWRYSIGSTIDPQNNTTVHTLSPIAGCASLETQTDYYDGSSSLLATTKTQYQVLPAIDVINTNYVKNASVAGALPAVITTQLPDGSTKTTTYYYPNTFQAKDYLSNSPQVSFPYGQASTKTETDYGGGSGGAILRCTGTTYRAFDGLQNSTGYLAANLINLPAAISVYGGACSGTPIARTTYGYDETSLQSSGISTQRDTSVSTPGTRGNQTSVQRKSDSNGGTVKETVVYFDTGMPYQSTDPRENTTTFAYSTAYQGAFLGTC